MPQENISVYTFSKDLHPQPYTRWSTFPSPPILHYYMIGCLMTFVSMWGSVSNGFVMFAFIRARKKPGSIFLCNLSAVGFLGSALPLPMLAISSFKRTWIFGDALCQAYGFAVGLGGMCSISSMAAIALDRYRAIVKGVHPHSWHGVIWITLIWLYSGFWVGLPFVGFGSYVKNSYGISCSFKYIGNDRNTTLFVVTIFLGGFILPLTMIVWCYTSIFLKVFNNEVRLRLYKCRSDFRAEGRRRADIKIAKVSAVVVLFFCMSWLPLAMTALLCTFVYNQFITPQIDIVTELLGKSSVIVSPIIYTVGHPVLKQTFIYCKRRAEGRSILPLDDFKSTGRTTLPLKN